MAAEHSTKGSEGLTPQSDLRLVLLGKVGAGKSVVAGHILGEGNWKDRGMCVKKQGEVAGRTVTVVETPGWDRVSVKRTSSRIKKEIVNSVTLLPPGPHALLLVVPLGEEISGNEKKSNQHHMELLSERVWKHTMLLFVSEEEDTLTLSKQVMESTKTLLEKCGGRYHVLCGPSSNRTQVTELLQKIEVMVEDNADEFFLPQVYYDLFERKMPREVSETRRMYEERMKQSLAKQKQRYEWQLKNMEDLYKTEMKAKEGLRKRRSSLDIPLTFSGEEQQTKDDLGHQKVDLEVVRDGYKEAGMAVMKHYIKPLFMIITTIVAAFFGAIAGAQYGPLGSCLGIVVGIGVSVVVCYAVREAATAARDIPCSTPVQTKHLLL
ncbi:GTPase IMAP family member 4-like [Osmerus eperlanus]|uniref:GTPase IMAP family member 4-like n=1 Tax=Osmerus eperlanus TaxID=29151 RepID=UPI002E14631E